MIGSNLHSGLRITGKSNDCQQDKYLLCTRIVLANLSSISGPSLVATIRVTKNKRSDLLPMHDAVKIPDSW